MPLWLLDADPALWPPASAALREPNGLLAMGGDLSLERLRQGMEKFRIALMCAEKDPLECHRAVLVARQMHDAGTPVQHILADGQLETHQDMELRMLELHNMSEHDMFSTREEIIMDTYRAHGEQIAYQDEALLKEELASGDKS